MMIFSQQDNPALPMDEQEKGPGRLLKEARLACGSSVTDVAARLRLSPATVHRLEEEDYERLPAIGFVRGYLNAYARLLKVAPAPILAAFDRHELAPPKLVGELAPQRSQMSSNHFLMRAATYCIVLFISTLVFSWWKGTIHPNDYTGFTEFGVLLESPASSGEKSPYEEREIVLGDHALALSGKGGNSILSSVGSMDLAVSNSMIPSATNTVPRPVLPRTVIAGISDIPSSPVNRRSDDKAWHSGHPRTEIDDTSGDFQDFSQTENSQTGSPFRIILEHAHAAEVSYDD